VGTPAHPKKWQASSTVIDFKGLAFGNDGSYWGAGNFYESGDFGCGQVTHTGYGISNGFLAKLDPATGLSTQTLTFNQLAAPSDSANGLQAISGLAVASAGSAINIGIIGSFTPEIDFSAKDSAGTVSAGNPNGDIGTAGIDFLTTTSTSGNDYYAVLSNAGGPVAARKVDVGNGSLQAVASNPNVSAFAICGKADKKVASYNATTTTGILNHSFTYTTGDGMDIVVAKIDAATGAVIWGWEFGGAGDQLCQSVAIDNNGDVIIAGGYNGALQFGTLPPFTTISDPTVSALYVARLASADGTPLASTAWGNTGKVFPYGLTVDSATGTTSGNIILAGKYTVNIPFGGGHDITSLGLANAFVAKLSSSLSPVWARTFGDAANKQEADGVAVASNGDIYTAGSFVGSLGAMNLTAFSTLNADGFLAKLAAADGSVVCAEIYGDATGIQGVGTVAVAPTASGTLADSLAIGGSFTSTITFGSTTLNSGGPSTGASFQTRIVP
jgi:hypothetical protein